MLFNLFKSKPKPIWATSHKDVIALGKDEAGLYCYKVIWTKAGGMVCEETYKFPTEKSIAKVFKLAHEPDEV
jgi:hypothetical protein